jgi:hypothetical protein
MRNRKKDCITNVVSEDTNHGGKEQLIKINN